jgi:hypothetical protein
MSEQSHGELMDPTDWPSDPAKDREDHERNIVDSYARLEAVFPGIKEKLRSMSVDDREQLARDLEAVVYADETLPQ